MPSNYRSSLYSAGHSGQPGAPPYTSRSSQSPATGEGLQAHSYDHVNTPFAMSMSVGPNHPTLLSQPSHHHHLHNPILNSQASQPPTPSAVTPNSDAYSRAPPTPGYYAAQSSTSQPPSFSSFTTTPSPQQASPTTAGSNIRGMPALTSQQHNSMQAHPHYASRPNYYSPLPSAMGGAVLSNMGNPGGQIALMNPMNPLASSYHPHGGHPLGPPHHSLYPGAPTTPQDRPYRCDTCPQSFNRNHDLKRHKRIHLAVKPYPCTYCDKAFSRKDALKRHRLVKGCGNRSPSSARGDSPIEDVKLEPSDPIKNEPH
ncbi:hypothetical protein F5Y18DRAFT_440429 [Xylariaceae sp. FL1019]|nr:hypothetical protein F5Y18DRAFT_440429 [Xylariaceae sp. FL1019]